MAFAPTVTKTDVLQNIPPDVSEVYIDTADNLRLQSFFISNSSSSSIIIYFHGNAGNIYERIPELINLSKTGVSVLGIGYRGYGKSTGKLSERGIYLDGQAALRYAEKKLNYRKEKIFLCGRSLGSVVALEMARNNNYAGVVLIAPLTSGREILKAHNYGPISLLVGDVIDNMKKVPDISSPVLIIHGDKDEVVPWEMGEKIFSAKDEVVPWEMGEKIFSALKNSKQIVTISGGRHSDLEFVNPALYYGSIKQFISAHANE